MVATLAPLPAPRWVQEWEPPLARTPANICCSRPTRHGTQSAPLARLREWRQARRQARVTGLFACEQDSVLWVERATTLAIIFVCLALGMIVAGLAR